MEQVTQKIGKVVIDNHIVVEEITFDEYLIQFKNSAVEWISDADSRVIAANVSEEDYMEKYAADFTEWEDGLVIKMSPVQDDHNYLSLFLAVLFDAYLSITGGGWLFIAPMVMRVPEVKRRREPDLQIILPGNEAIIGKTMIDGASDLVVEIVSPDSTDRDRGDKFKEYERGGVKEYWILDPIRHEALFYVRHDDSLFRRIDPDQAGYYHSTVLPKLRLKVAIFWQKPLPRTPEIVEMVKMMVNQS